MSSETHCAHAGVDSVYGVSEVDPPVTDSADLVNRDIHAVAHVFTNGEEIEGGCAIHFGVSGGSYTAYHAALGRTEYRSPDCVCIGVRDHSGFTTGFGSLSRSYGLTRVGPDDMSYSRRHTYENGIIIWLPSPCVGEGGGGDPPPPPELVKVDTTTMLTSIEHSDASVTNHHLQGVIAYYSDGSTVRLGMYASPAYAPVATTPSTPNTLEFSTSVDETFVITVPHDAVGLQDFVFSEAFEQFDGDMNGDGSVCWTDRKLFVDALGSTIGDGRYRARGDFDLDGDVDAADYAAYVAEFAARASCTSDYDCGGSVNSSDTSAFLTAWNADVTNGTLYADFDGNGTTNSADISAFLAQWKIGRAHV